MLASQLCQPADAYCAVLASLHVWSRPGPVYDQLLPAPDSILM